MASACKETTPKPIHTARPLPLKLIKSKPFSRNFSNNWLTLGLFSQITKVG